MRISLRLLITSCILALVVLACSVTFDMGPSGAPTATRQISPLDNVSTMVAQTLAALTQGAPTSTPTRTATPVVTPTNTPLPATLSVSTATDCYAGPSTRYGFVITIRPGTIVTVTGQDIIDNYWIIEVPGYPGTLCWLSGQYASVTGDTRSLPAPATPLASNYTLSEPRNLRISCSVYYPSGTPDPWWEDKELWTIVVRWKNTDPDQTGVRFYRNGHHLATLGRNASSYTDTTVSRHHHHDDRDLTYGVQAFNATEVSSIVTIDLRRCK